ncbi:MAG: geranylgeranylglyceryl/heptaprenylglyceryl phosphate synthase [Candidatus Altiarchaeota archaeon]
MENVIEGWLVGGKRLHFTLIDPDKQSPKEASEMAEASESFGSNALMIGGSTADAKTVNEVTKAIKESVNIPVILFPGSAEGVSPYADYIFFMSCLNSTKRRFLVSEQVKGAPLVKKAGIAIIPLGYILISTSDEPTTVEKVAEPDPIGPNDLDKAVAYALTAQYFGMHTVYLEAGSGAKNPIPPEMIKKVKEALDIPLIVGGGIHDPQSAKAAVEAGADVIVNGTTAEKDMENHREIVKAVISEN